MIFSIKTETKKHSTEWEKKIVHRTSDKGLISKIYKKFILFNKQKTNNPIKN